MSRKHQFAIEGAVAQKYNHSLSICSREKIQAQLMLWPQNIPKSCANSVL